MPIVPVVNGESSRRILPFQSGTVSAIFRFHTGEIDFQCGFSAAKFTHHLSATHRRHLHPLSDPSFTAPIRPLSPQMRIEAATLDDLPQLVDLVMALMELEEDFQPDREKQETGLRLVLEQPNRGRIFVIRTDYQIVGMVNLLFTISTAMGGFVLLMEDVIIHPDHRGQGFGTQLMEYVIEFAQKKDFKRITLLTDQISAESQRFFQKIGFQHSHMIPMRMTFNGGE